MIIAMVQIRLAKPAEHAEIQALVADAGLPLDGLSHAWRAWVAVADGRIVGTASLERHGDALLLRSVAVVSTERGQGIGQALVVAALAAADLIGPVSLLTETAPDWFPRFGFQPVARDALHPALASSPELRGACPATAQAFTRVHASHTESRSS
jgi:amino-acid N-acetyltransferase